MKRKKKTLILVLLGLSVWLCGCTSNESNEDIETETVSSEIDESYYLEHVGNYNAIEKIIFEENFGLSEQDKEIGAKVTITKEHISYELTPTLAGNMNECIFAEDMNQQSWDILIEIIKKYQLKDWDEQSQYYYQGNFTGAVPYVNPGKVEYIKQGKFFDIDPKGIYLGMDRIELAFRTAYKGETEIYSKEGYVFWGTMVGKYESYRCPPEYYDRYYGIPPQYNEYRQELWDFIIEYTEGYDWRIGIDIAGEEAMYQTFPYMIKEKSKNDSYQNVRYFSIVESYGGKDSNLNAQFIYDGGMNNCEYSYGILRNVYSVNNDGFSYLYIDDKQPLLITRDFFLSEALMSDVGVDYLVSLMEKYQVLDWNSTEMDSSYTEYVNQGAFFNKNYFRDIQNADEEELRNSYCVLINMICSDGIRKEVFLTNGNLPQAYNEFRTELWDYFIEYSYRSYLTDRFTEYQKSGFDENLLTYSYEDQLLMELEEHGWAVFLKRNDWRNYIDKHGYQYMLLKYPYMEP